MTTRRNVLLAGGAFALPLMPLLSRSAKAYSQPAWHALSQSQRNAAIVGKAYESTNLQVGKSCKEWVRMVVMSLSGGYPSGGVPIPSTRPAPNDYLWEPDGNGNVIGMSLPIGSVPPGYIVQMRIRGTSNPSLVFPHTAIVVSNGGGWVRFIESNFDNTPYVDSDAYVRLRDTSWEDFNRSLGTPYSSFSVYYIR